MFAKLPPEPVPWPSFAYERGRTDVPGRLDARFDFGPDSLWSGYFGRDLLSGLITGIDEFHAAKARERGTDIRPRLRRTGVRVGFARSKIILGFRLARQFMSECGATCRRFPGVRSHTVATAMITSTPGIISCGVAA